MHDPAPGVPEKRCADNRGVGLADVRYHERVARASFFQDEAGLLPRQLDDLVVVLRHIDAEIPADVRRSDRRDREQQLDALVLHFTGIDYRPGNPHGLCRSRPRA